MRVRSQQNDTVDAIVWRYLGDTAGYVESTLELNPALAQYGAVLPSGTVMTLPAPTASIQTKKDIVQLWD
jgi:phage tail protein X